MTEFPPTSARIHTLKNGLTIIIDDSVDAPVVSCQAWVETGSMHEFPLLGSGVSHLLEHMVFKGTEKYTGEQLADTVQSAGGQWNAYTSFDRTVYYIDGPARSTETFLDVLTEMVFRPTFPKDDFETERDVIRREIDMGLDSPESQGSQLLFSTVYQRDGRRHPVIGHLELFNALSYEDMCDYHHRRYSPPSVFVSIAGQFDADEVIKFLEKSTPAERPTFDDQPVLPREPKQLGSRLNRRPFAVPTSHLTLAWQGPDLTHPDAAALDIFSTILGSGRSSILYRRLREERGLCHHIGSMSWLPADGPGLFAISAEVEPEGRDSLQQEILDLVTESLRLPLDDAIKKACRMSLTSQFRTLTTASGRASDLASNWHEARNLDLTRDYVEQLSRVTAADIRAAVQKWLIPSSLSVLSLDPIETDTEVAQTTDFSTNRPPLSVHQLSNGLKVVLGPDPSLPLVNICTASLAGLPAETVDNAGVGTLLATVMDRGTSSHDAETIATTLDESGAKLGFSCGNNTFVSKLECLEEDSASLTALLGDIFTQAQLPEDAIDREKAAIQSAILASREKPLPEAMRQARRLLFGTHGYGLEKLGSEKSAENLDRLTLSAHASLHLRANNTVLAAFGSFDNETMLAQLESAFASLPSGEKFTPPASQITPGQDQTIILEKEQAALVVAFPTPAFGDQAVPALELLDAYTSDMSGPIFGRIREELGLAYTASTALWQGIDTGMYSFYLATSPDQLELAEAEMLKQIEKISKNGIPLERFEAAKASLIASQELSNQSNGARSLLSAVDTLLGHAPDHFREKSATIAALQPDDVKQAAASVLSAAATISRVTASGEK